MFWWIVATIGAFFVKGLCGFANTLVFTTVLSFGNNNVNISPVELILGYPTNIILAWKENQLSGVFAVSVISYSKAGDSPHSINVDRFSTWYI